MSDSPLTHAREKLAEWRHTQHVTCRILPTRDNRCLLCKETDDLLALLADTRAATLCACQMIGGEPCQPNCSCRNPALSGGCLCCATYGSPEQQLAAAARIKARAATEGSEKPRKLKPWELARVVKRLEDEIRDRQRYPGSVAKPAGDPGDIEAMKAALDILYSHVEAR